MALIAYRKEYTLIESMIACYKIYVLKNPIDNAVFYVGLTSKKLSSRLSGHMGDVNSKSSGKNKAKVDFIKSILNNDEKPIIEAVETINGTCYVDKVFALERELFWIKHYKDLGIPITNSAGINSDGTHSEYQFYLSSLQSGSISPRYYLCGTNSDGVKVYDTNRIMADGCYFEQKVTPVRKIYKEFYFPFKNNRFITKNEICLDGSKPIIRTEHFPIMPSWTPAFLKSIPFDDIFEDFEIDDCDLEDCELENDMSDYEDEHDNDTELEDSHTDLPKVKSMCLRYRTEEDDYLMIMRVPMAKEHSQDKGFFND